MVKAIHTRLASRGYSAVRRQLGEIHTFAFFPSLGWHCDLLSDLRVLGPVTHFDYLAAGYQATDIYRGGVRGINLRKAMNDLVRLALQTAHSERPVDWVFVYASGAEISPQTIRGITDELGIPTVNMCLDDKQSWEGIWSGDHHTGQVDIAAEFDLSWTSARLACEWYLAEGGRPIYMPEGFDMIRWRPTPREQDIPVSFIGAAYGCRPSLMSYLRDHGVAIQAFGSGWQDSAWVENPVEIVNRSLINLGIGAIGFSETLTNVKARDFEIPAVGAGAYLTTFNADLAQHFAVGREILCYHGRDEMLELIRYYLAHPDEAQEIAHRGRERCLAEHRWLHRYLRVCEILGILQDGGQGKAGSPDNAEAMCTSPS
ncbi:MAG: glycosyltransferase [Bryobacteraceae bacterium]